MSLNVTLVVIGVVLCLIGLAMLGSSRHAGSSILQKNFGFNIGSKSDQSNEAGNGTGGNKNAKPNWVGLAIAVIGFLTAVIGVFKT
jgi:hypothetical protein